MASLQRRLGCSSRLVSVVSFSDAALPPETMMARTSTSPLSRKENPALKQQFTQLRRRRRRRDRHTRGPHRCDTHGIVFRVPRIRSFTTTNTTSNAAVVDYFEVFGLPRKIGIDQNELKRAYLKLMKEHHPDKQQQQQQRQQQQQQQQDTTVTAETITHAYQTLTSPHTRALHWLDLHGCPLVGDQSRCDDDEEGKTNDDTDLVGMDFLMEIMETREAIEDARSDQAELRSIAEETKILHEKCVRDLSELVDGNENDAFGADASSSTLGDARKLTAQLQYWHRLEETLRDATEVG